MRSILSLAIACTALREFCEGAAESSLAAAEAFRRRAVPAGKTAAKYTVLDPYMRFWRSWRAGARTWSSAECGATGTAVPLLAFIGVTEARNPATELTSAAPPSISDAVGGPLGIGESVLPTVAFVTTYTATGQDTEAALIAAVGLGVLFTVARIVRGKTVQFALAGLGGLALSAYVVSRTGKAEDFFLPGLLANAAYALAYLISILVRWPLLGVIVATLRRQGMDWRQDPAAVRSYSRASWVWVALFSLRLAVQLPLYLASALTALGVARIAMGLPLFAVGIWLSWLILRPRQPAAAAA